MKNIVITLLTCSVSMSALALIYIAAMPFLARRYSVKGLYYAWLIVVIGMIIPFRPQWDNAIFKVDMPGGAVSPITRTGPLSTPVISTIMPDENATASAGAATPTKTTRAPVENTALHLSASKSTWQQIAAAAWIAGMLALLSYHLIRHHRFVRLTRRWSEPVEDEDALELLRKLKAEMGIKKQISIYICSCVSSPVMIGLTKPSILLPVSELPQDELRFIIAHELVHHRRKDLLYKYLVLAATAIHWFNPAFYLMARAIDILCEMSCDAEVVRDADMDTRRLYSETIIGVVRYQTRLRTSLSTSFYGSKKDLKGRLMNIININRKKWGIAVVCAALAATIGSGCVFSPGTGTPPDSDLPESAYTETVGQRIDVGAGCLI